MTIICELVHESSNKNDEGVVNVLISLSLNLMLQGGAVNTASMFTWSFGVPQISAS